METKTIVIGLVALLLAGVVVVLCTSDDTRRAGAADEAPAEAARPGGALPERALVPVELPEHGGRRSALVAQDTGLLGESADESAGREPDSTADAAVAVAPEHGAHGVAFDTRGEPAAQYQVRLIALGPGGIEEFGVAPRFDARKHGPRRKTDAAGAFVFADSYSGLHQLWAYRPGGPAWPGPVVDLVPGVTTAPIEFQMLGQWDGPSTEIVVADPDGEPVAGAELKLEYQVERGRVQRAKGKSDANGAFLWAGYEGEALTSVRVDPKHAAWAGWESGPLEPGLARLFVQLEERSVFVLTVVDRAGAPVTEPDGIRITSRRAAERSKLLRPEAADGRWEFPLPSESCSVRVWRTGYVDWDRSFEDPGQLLPGLTVTLERAPRVRLRVTERGVPVRNLPVALMELVVPRSLPLADAVLELVASGDESVWTARSFAGTDAAGEAEFPIVAGESYRVGAWGPMRGAALSAVFVAGAGGHDVTLALEERTHVDGRFVPPEGVAVERVRLELLDWHGEGTPVELDERGKFELPAVMPGAVVFQASWTVGLVEASGDGLAETRTLGPYRIPDARSTELVVSAADSLRTLRVSLPALVMKARGELFVSAEDPELAVIASVKRARFRGARAEVRVPRPGVYRVTVTSQERRGPELVLVGRVRVGEDDETLWEPPLVLGRLLAFPPDDAPKPSGSARQLRYVTTLDDGTLAVALLRMVRQRVKGKPARYGIDAELPVGGGARLVLFDGREVPIGLQAGATVEVELPLE